MQIQKECDDTALLQQLDAVLAEVGGALAPFDPYLHWSLNQRCCFFEEADAELVREYAGGVAIIRVEKMFYVARRFLRTGGWFWSAVALLDAQANNHMLMSMMEGTT
ncbi:MAG: hypothetical protein B7Z05_06145 [Thiotrichales bacterium 32-46-8]|nr:MAG: hypothetical protein B7Z05_06145 [Thiotrichales bacterium 32-46-8]OZA97539.1 MAG: hypothetical protein B7X52_02640 [Thiotrichales bacterium 34-46-19]UCG18961.1 MAG: hypothetical protein JSU84_01700 [Thiotrichales bacterium]